MLERIIPLGWVGRGWGGGEGRRDFITLAFNSISPENVPRLVDLVRPKDAKFLTAFYFGLKDTLVTENLDQATRIGLQVS